MFVYSMFPCVEGEQDGANTYSVTSWMWYTSGDQKGNISNRKGLRTRCKPNPAAHEENSRHVRTCPKPNLLRAKIARSAGEKKEKAL